MKAEYITAIKVGEETIMVYRDPESGGLFGIDATFVELYDTVNSPYNDGKIQLPTGH